MSGQIFRQIFEKTMNPSILLKFRTKVAIGPHIILLKGFCDAFHRLVHRGDQMSGQLFRQIFDHVLPVCKIRAKSKGSSFFIQTSIWPLLANLWDASQNPSRGMMRGSCATCVQNLGEIEGVVVFHLDIYLASIGQSMGCIAKSFKGDDEGIMCYLCAKFGRNRRGRRFLR